MPRLCLLCLPIVLYTTLAGAQGTRSDYERADSLARLTRNQVFKTSVEPHWFAENQQFWYRNDLPEGCREFLLVDAEAGTRQLAFDHDRLAEALSAERNNVFQATRLPFDVIELADDGSTLRFNLDDQGWTCDLETYALEPTDPHELSEASERTSDQPRGRGPRGGRSSTSTRSPDGRHVAFIQDHNLHLRDTKTNEEFPLSTDGEPGHDYSGNVFWSPDSSKLVARRTKAGFDRTVHLIESAPQDQLQPRLHSLSYRKPGDDMPITKPRLFDVAERKEIPVSDQLFMLPWSVSRFHWQPDSKRFFFLYNERGHQTLRLIAIDAETGGAELIILETSPTFIDYAHKEYTRYLDETDEIIWMSERDGWNHLYLIDSRDGTVKAQITEGEWIVRSVDRVDEAARQIWFRASGIHAEQDPYDIHFARVNFDGSDLTILTEGDGTHAIDFSPDRRFFIDTYSRVDLPPRTELRKSDNGALVCELEEADWSVLLELGWQVPERFVAKGRDGETDIHGVIFRPTTFDPNLSYPVIEQIYAGPQGAFVPKGFRPFHAPQGIAELGFIVVQIDGMGTSHRSKAFHDVCWRNLADAGFPDRIPWIKAAADHYSYMDLSRVGVYGGSAGGQSALRALLAHGDFYKVAVADCGCHDNRIDKIWWNELWMGWPIGPHYEEQSNVTNAHKLEGKLLLIVGELDRNVDPASTMQVVDALVKADKDFDLLVIPGAGHGAAGTPYGRRRHRDFLVRHLLNVEPRSEP